MKVNVDYRKSIVEVYTAFTRKLLNKSVLKMLLLSGIWDRKTLPPTRNADKSDEAPSWVYDFRLKKLKRGASRPWEHPLEDDMDIEDMESPRIGWVTNPFSRRLHIALILLDEIEDVEVSPIGVGSDYFNLCHILYSRLEIFTKARNLPSHGIPSHEEIVRFAQVLGIKPEEYPGAVTGLAGLIIQGGQVAIRQAQQGWQTGDGFTNAVLDEEERELTSMVRRLSLGGAFFSTKRGWIGTGPSIISRNDVVVRIIGLLTPCILRPVEGQDDYLLVGDCYVHDEVGWGKITTVSLA